MSSLSHYTLLFRNYNFYILLSDGDKKCVILKITGSKWHLYIVQLWINSRISMKFFPFYKHTHIFSRFMSLLIGDICLQADVDIEIIATILLFLYILLHKKFVLHQTCKNVSLGMFWIEYTHLMLNKFSKTIFFFLLFFVVSK